MGLVCMAEWSCWTSSTAGYYWADQAVSGSCMQLLIKINEFVVGVCLVGPVSTSVNCLSITNKSATKSLCLTIHLFVPVRTKQNASDWFVLLFLVGIVWPRFHV